VEKKKVSVSAAFKLGCISLAFLILGFQTALFVHKAAVTKIVACRDHPDTVYVYMSPKSSGETSAKTETAWKRDSTHRSGTSSSVAKQIARKYAARRTESFRFDPNTVSTEDLQRLGFSEKQAAAIENYRLKGGRFRRKEDFAKSFVVADSVYRRLESFIDIPLLDINTADSAEFDALPGIGPYFASAMVKYRDCLGGYSCTRQLMEIYHFDESRYAAIADLVYCSGPSDIFRLWSLPADSLRLHPHIRNMETARAIVFYREHNPRSEWTVEGLRKAGVISEETAERIGRCVIEKP